MRWLGILPVMSQARWLLQQCPVAKHIMQPSTEIFAMCQLGWAERVATAQAPVHIDLTMALVSTNNFSAAKIHLEIHARLQVRKHMTVEAHAWHSMGHPNIPTHHQVPMNNLRTDPLANQHCNDKLWKSREFHRDKPGLSRGQAR